MRYQRLRDRLESEGQWLFRWRSFVPLVLLPSGLVALAEAAQLETALGHGYEGLRLALCLAIALAGLAIRWGTVGFVPAGTSGRNTSGQRAETLNTTGLYSLVRNPLYLGNLLAILGVAMTTMVWWFVALVGLAYWLYIERVIAAEEAYLARKFGPAYATWVARTPAFLPQLNRWQPPAERFSLPTVLRREYNGIMAVGTAFLVSEMALDLMFRGETLDEWLRDDSAWLMVFVAAATAFIVLRTLKKHTRLLHLPGR